MHEIDSDRILFDKLDRFLEIENKKMQCLLL